MDELDKREMVFWVAEYNRSRHWKTARGSASACWGVLCGELTADPLELEAGGWRVVKCVATAVETDLRFRAVTAGKSDIEQQGEDIEQLRADSEELKQVLCDTYSEWWTNTSGSPSQIARLVMLNMLSEIERLKRERE